MVSGIVWLIAGAIVTTNGVRIGFGVLFFGGMLIFPVASLIARSCFGRPKVSPGNPGGLTVIETIFPMIGGFLAAWLLIPYRPDLAFPISAIAVGAHYFGFRTAYGDWTNWVLGGFLCAVGMGAIFYGLPARSSVPYVVAAIEIVFGCWLTWMSLVKENTDTSVGQGVDIGGLRLHEAEQAVDVQDASPSEGEEVSR